MTFREVTDLLCLSGPDLADIFGVQEQSVRTWRLEPGSPNYRRAPDGWQKRLLPVAQRRYGEVGLVIEYLEGAG